MQSQLKAFWDGARRGFRFGAVAGVTIWLVIRVVGLGFILLVPELRERVLAEWANESAFSAIGGCLATFVLMAVYGAVPGAMIMGVAGVIRARKVESSETR